MKPGWEIVIALILAIVPTVVGFSLNWLKGWANNVEGDLKEMLEQIKKLNDVLIRHDERLTSFHERLDNHDKRIQNLENNERLHSKTDR